MAQQNYPAIPLVLILTVIGVASCSAEKQFPIPENQFCSAIMEGRSSYAEAGTIQNLDEANRIRREIRAQRKKEMFAILPKGEIMGWDGKVKSLMSPDHTAQLKLEIPCHDVLLIDQEISKNSPLFLRLQKLGTEQDLIFFGVFEPSLVGDPDAFLELSATEAESLSKPKFLINLLRVFSGKSAPSEEQLRQAHQAVESYLLSDRHLM